jgi:peptide/nickel transport system substrate-binding protein
VAPFTDVRVRRAVEYAIDRRAVVRLFGGLARPTENLLPPTYPSYSKLALYPHDLAKARTLVRSAGAEGAKIKVWGPAAQPYQTLTAYLASVLDSIGLKASIASVQPATFQSIVGNQATRAQIGWNFWLADYPNPIDWFDTLLNGEHITQTHNNTLANANDPAINRLSDRLREAPRLTSAVNAGWARVDRMILTKAFIAPAVNVLATNAFASRVDMSCYVDQVIYGYDWTQACVR